ncbi:MAG: carbohydrate ABC transporter substrate-binding protein, partial [Lachnospiraceae bacterium]
MKKKVVTKLVALGLVAAMTATMAAGCGSKGDKKESKDSDKVLKVAAFEGGYGKDLWTDVAKAFEETHDGVKVELQVDKKIEDKITPAMKSGDYPDVIHCATGRDAGLTETITKEKGLTCLDDVMDMKVPGEDVTVKEKVLPGFLDTLGTQPYNDGKTYYAPMFYAPCGLFYNAGLLKEKGWTVPTTWDEMWALGDKAKAEGISLFTYPH